MDRGAETQPTKVSHKTKQVGEIWERWPWVELSVWTERMLTALEQGVKGGKWFSLIDKVHSQQNLYAGYLNVSRNDGAAGVDHVTVGMFTDHLEENLKHLSRTLRDTTYQPQPVKRTWIPKPGSTEKRPLGIPTVRDRVVQTALRNVLEPIFERDFAEHSYGFRPGRSCKDALRRVDTLLKAGYRYIVDADLKSYFDTIPHDQLMAQVEKKVSDGRVLKLIMMFIKQGIMEDLREWTPEEGSPQGAVISPLLSDIYLDPLDHRMAKLGYEMTRYADDFVIQCRSREEAERALEEIQRWTAQAGLKLHPQKTRIVDAQQKREGFDFLGYHFECGHRWPRDKSIQKLKATIRAKTKRTNGHSLKVIIRDVTLTLRGWFEYFKHNTYPSVFRRLDEWIRMRIRSILRRRRKKHGRGRGPDHHRCPNAYFAAHGLLSLSHAHIAAR